MNGAIKNYMDKKLRIIYSFAKHGGSDAAAIVLGRVPLNFVPTRVDSVCVVPFAGATATLSLGTTNATTKYLSAQAITSFATKGNVISTALTSQNALNDTTGTTGDQTVQLQINTANLTAGAMEFYLSGFVPILDQTTLTGA